MTATIPPMLSAGNVLLDVLAHVLTGPAGSERLDGGPFIVLRELLKRPGAVVSTKQLIAAAWDDPDLEPQNPEAAIRARVCRARDALERVGASRDQLRLNFPRGYSLEGEKRIPWVLTPSQSATLRRLIATHPDRAAAAELAPC